MGVGERNVSQRAPKPPTRENLKALNSKEFLNFYGIRLVVVTSLKCSIGRAKYINIRIGWIKQQNNASALH